MMLLRLPYRYQIPLGLTLGVVITALLVSTVAAQISARSARQETLATVNSAVALLGVQARPLLAADDTWRIFALLKNTAALLPGVNQQHARAAILDTGGRVVAASDPINLETGHQILGNKSNTSGLVALSAIKSQVTLTQEDKAITLVDPIRSEDGQILGFSYVQIDDPVFDPNWTAISKPALIGALLAVVLLTPIGWLAGIRMARPVSRLAYSIAQIGHVDTHTLLAALPKDEDPELAQIGDAVKQLVNELDVRRQAERRALSAQRMAAVGRIAAVVAHEINNPLGGLLTATQTLRLHGQSEATRIKSVALIERGLQQIRSTVAALLPQARVESRTLELNDLEDVLALVQPDATRRNITITARSELMSVLHVPSASVRQAMLNLLLNAIKAAGEHGWVTAVLEGNPNAVRFTVSNSGQRLTPDDLERSIAAESGNDPRGFGLWVCREIASQFEGQFEIVDPSAQATGLVFWIPNRDRDAIAAIN